MISRHDRLQHRLPSIGAVNIAGAQGAAFQIAILVENEQRMIAGAVIVTVPDTVFLFAMRRAHARIHIEQDTSRRTATMNAVDPLAGEISERRKVLFRREPARLKAAHLARRSRCIRGRLSADYPPHRSSRAGVERRSHLHIRQVAQIWIAATSRRVHAGHSCQCVRRRAHHPPSR